MKLSTFADRFNRVSGTRQLMDDLGDVLNSGRDIANLGGGNPGFIPEVQAIYRARMQALIDSGEFDRLAANYEAPQGPPKFLATVAAMLKARYGWNLSAANVMTTAGSQSSFFMLFNLFGGTHKKGLQRKILFPLAPEYIGYTDLGLTENMFTANRPRIHYDGEHTYKYHIDFEQLRIDDGIGAVCITRPTNPTGNVITDDELTKLSQATASAGLPLIIDNAYGLPFPNIIFSDVKMIWNEQIILCMSLSKLGLPGLRTGVIIANEKIINILISMTANFMLANNSLGPTLVEPLIRNGDLLELCQDHIRPYYEDRSRLAVQWCHHYFDGLDYRVHKSEGAIFLWLWFPKLPISSQTLYERLKKKGVLVLSGHHFFPGLSQELAQPWEHTKECLRVSYAQAADKVEAGIKLIAEEVKHAFNA